MTLGRVLAIALVVCGTFVSAARAQESRIAADYRKEGDDIHRDCVENKAIVGCLANFFTAEPVHVSFGTIAPQNGMGAGPALVWHWTPSSNWRWTGSGDAAWAGSGAWRAGAYATIVRTNVEVPTVVVGGGGAPRRAPRIHPYPVIKLYTQSISLPTIFFFGIGPDSNVANKSVFGETEHVTGGSVIWPITPDNNFDRLALSIFGEVNGRWVSIRPGTSDDAPSIQQLYTPVIAPGLSFSSQPGFVQFGEGVRISPSLAGGHVRLSYFAKYQQFQAPSDSLLSFQRWTVDLNHEFPLYGSSIPGGKDHNTPNNCSTSPSDRNCPPVALSRNRSGSFGFRALLSRSLVDGAAQVPFYFQQTLGGSDLDGNRVLPSYDDYRFRGPHLVLLQETFEHSLFGSPVGIWLSADQGKVLRQSDSFSAGDMAHSYAIGLSLRAGGLPVALATYANGPEGHHFAITVSPTLLGGSSRPALQ